jgi:N-acetylmuramoyl-L-alanine amidase
VAVGYRVVWVKGDYRARQEEANRQQAIAYVEQHFNSGPETANHGCVVLAADASPKCKEWAQTYAALLNQRLGVALYNRDGLAIGRFPENGEAHLYSATMPAILVRPLFGTNPIQADLIRSTEGQTALAAVLADSIKRAFPAGGVVAFSVGHKYRTDSPHDRGAPLAGGGLEADYAERVLEAAQKLLES